MRNIFLSIFVLFSLFSNGQVQRELAIQALEEGRFEEALDAFEDVYNRQPNDANYGYILDCYLGLKEYKDGIRFIQKHTDNARMRKGYYRIDEGYFYLLQKDTSKAEDVFNHVLEDIYTNPGLAYQYSERWKKWGNFKFALAAYETAERGDSNLNFDTQKALLYAELGMLREMYNAYLDVLEKNPNFLANLENVIRFNMNRDGEIPLSSELKQDIIQRIQSNEGIVFNKLLIWILISENEFNQAFGQLKALYLRDAIQSYEILQLGNQARDNSEYRSAIRIYSYLQQQGDKTPYQQDATLYLLQTKRKELEANSSDVAGYSGLMEEINSTLPSLKGSEKQAELLLTAAEMQFINMHQPDSALALIDKCLNITRTRDHINAEAKLLQGDIQLATGLPYDAILTYAQVESNFSTSPLGQEARFRKARVAFFTGEFEWALSSFDVLKASTSKLIANDAMRLSLLIKDNAALDTTYVMLEVYAKALLLKSQKRYAESLLTLDTLDTRLLFSKDHPLLDESLYTRAEILMSEAKYDSAATLYIQVAEKFPKDLLADESLIKAARIYLYHLHNEERAKELYEKVLLEHTNSIYAEEAREEYRKLRGDLNT